MESIRFLLLFLFFVSISGDVYGQYKWLTGRRLLQQQAECTIDFEKLNYTEVTSWCKGPNYNVEPCCKGFKRLACPYSDMISDMKTNCAKTMFSYINLYGKYPPGLFSSLCIEDKEGLNCKDTIEQLEKEKNAKSSDSGSQLTFSRRFSLFLAIITSLFCILSSW